MKSIQEELMEKMAKTYTQHLAQSMGATRDGLVWRILSERMYTMRMPRRGRYQIWRGDNLKADHIKHRKEALAMMKMFKSME